MRLAAYPSSGQVDSVLADWVYQAAQQENVDTSFVAAVVGLVTGLRPYPSRALEQRLLPLLNQGTAGRTEIGRVCTQHIETCRVCHEMLAERAKSKRLLVDGQHYVVYGYSGGIVRLLKDFARDFSPDNLTVAVVECKNRMDIDSAPSQIYELRRSAFRCHYIPVTSLARYVSEHRPTHILMGANLLVPDGVLNTIGSLSVVLVASRHNTPVSIIAPSYKAWNAEQFSNERGKVTTMQRPSDRAYAHLGLGTELFTQVFNYAYDLVPVEPPVSVFTDLGVFGTEDRPYSLLFSHDRT